MERAGVESVYQHLEGILSLTAQPHLSWSGYTRSNTGVVAQRVGTSSPLGPEVTTGLSRVSRVDRDSTRFVRVLTIALTAH